MQASEALRLAHETLVYTYTSTTIKAWQLAKHNFDLSAEQQEAVKTSYSTLH